MSHNWTETPDHRYAPTDDGREDCTGGAILGLFLGLFFWVVVIGATALLMSAR